MKFGCSFGIFLYFANLLCRSTDISKCFIGSLRLQDNEELTVYFRKKGSNLVTVKIAGKLSHKKTKATKWNVCHAKTQISLGICTVFFRHLKGSLGIKLPPCHQQRLCSDSTDANRQSSKTCHRDRKACLTAPCPSHKNL